MKVIYALESIPNSHEDGCIFLAGPTPREGHVPSWRPEALELIEKLGFEGEVFVPERRSGVWSEEYTNQIKWEWEGLDSCVHFGSIAVWVPRDLETMPAFTTNVEFGYYIGIADKFLWYGRPPSAPKTRYLDALYFRETRREPCETLETLLTECLEGMDLR